MISIVICEDEKRSRSVLLKYLKQLEKELGESFDLTVFSSGEELLNLYPHGTQIILMDIYMSKLNGVETVRKIRAFDENVCVIFITTMSQYAIECYKVRAFGFLTKPVAYIEFRQEMMEAIRRVKMQQKKFLMIKRGAETFKIEYGTILYVESQNHNIVLHTEKGDISFYKTMKEIEKELNQENGFFRCHIAYLVNQKHIRHIGQSSLSMSDGSSVAISKHRRTQFLEELMGYVG